MHKYEDPFHIFGDVKRQFKLKPALGNFNTRGELYCFEREIFAKSMLGMTDIFKRMDRLYF